MEFTDVVRIVHVPGEIMTNATVGLKALKDGVYYGAWVEVPVSVWEDREFSMGTIEGYLFDKLQMCQDGVTPPSLPYPDLEVA